MKSYKSQLVRFQANPIGALFILKIVKARPEGVEMGNWFEMIFGVHERDIIQYISIKPFTIPGYYKPVPHVRISGYRIPRFVPLDRRVWVRFDRKLPNVIEFEAPIAHGHEPRIFQMSLNEWNRIKKSLKPVSKEGHIFHEKHSLLTKNFSFA